MRQPWLEGAIINGHGDLALPARREINWTNVTTLVSVAILVGTELVGTGWAAGWALGGLFQLGDTISTGLELVFVGLGLAGLVWFMRVALRAEPVYRWLQ